MFGTLYTVCNSDFLIEYSDVCNSFCYSNLAFLVYWLAYLGINDTELLYIKKFGLEVKKFKKILDKRNKTLYNSPVVMVTTKTKHKLNTLLNYE